MKKIISLALVLVMAMALLTACGVELQAPSGVYATDSGTYKLTFGEYDAKENVGTLTITRTLMDLEDVVKGTYTVFVNNKDDNTFALDFTPEGGETIQNFLIYGATDNVLGQYSDVGEIGGNGSSYYPYVPEAE